MDFFRDSGIPLEFFLRKSKTQVPFRNEILVGLWAGSHLQTWWKWVDSPGNDPITYPSLGSLENHRLKYATFWGDMWSFPRGDSKIKNPPTCNQWQPGGSKNWILKSSNTQRHTPRTFWKITRVATVANQKPYKRITSYEFAWKTPGLHKETIPFPWIHEANGSSSMIFPYLQRCGSEKNPASWGRNHPFNSSLLWGGKKKHLAINSNLWRCLIRTIGN